MGFPLACCRADVLALWPAEGLWSGQMGLLVIRQFYFFLFLCFFFLKALILLSGSKSHILQSRRGGRGEFLATGEGRGGGGGTNSRHLCVCTDSARLKKNSVSGGYIAQF